MEYYGLMYLASHEPKGVFDKGKEKRTQYIVFFAS
jgi:hypothetical protein